MKKLIFAILFVLTTAPIFAQTPAKGVMVDTNGVLLTPTNFFSTNATAWLASLSSNAVAARASLGLRDMALQPTNGPAFATATNYGRMTFTTNAANLAADGVVALIQDYYGVHFGSLSGGGNIRWNPTHGPGPTQGELEILGYNRMSLLAGYDQQHNGAIQIGSASFGSPQMAAEEIYINRDVDANASVPFGYSKSLTFHCSFYNGGQFTVQPGIRSEAYDLIGDVGLSFYTTMTPNVLIGQSAGKKQLEIHTNGLARFGKMVYSSPKIAVASGGVYTVDFDKDSGEQVYPAGNFTVNYLVPIRTNQTTTKVITFVPDFATVTPTWPASWIWGGSTTSGGTAPATIPANTRVEVTVRCVIDAETNFYASAAYYPYTPYTDPDAQNYFVNAGAGNITGTFSNAVNHLAIDLKSFSCWTNKLIAGYPVAPNATAGLKDLKGSHHLTQSGSITWSAAGPISDGTTGYLDTGLNMSTTFASVNSACFALAVTAPATPSDNYFFGATDSASHRVGMNKSGANMQSQGLFNGTAGENVVSASGDFRKTWTLLRTASTTQTFYINGVQTGNTNVTAAAAGPNLNCLLLCRSSSGTPSNFCDSSTSIGIFLVLENVTGADMANLNTAINNFLVATGRR